MTATVTIEIPAEREALVRRLLALTEELEQLALSAPDGTVFDACESAVVHGGRDLSTQILADTVARRIETAEKKGAPIRVCECGRRKENRGAKTRQLVSAVGVVALTRRYWQCRCGEAGSYAVDGVLGIEGRFSKTVQKHCCRLGAELGFASTSEHLHEMLGVDIAAETVRTMVEEHGRAMARFQPEDAQTAAAFAQAAGAVEFAVDAGKVNTREERWKDLKIAVISKRPAGKPTAVEQWDGQRLPAATMVLAFAMIATAKTFRRSWRKRLRQLGVTCLAGVHALGDGAAWIWKSVERALTGCTQTLDFYHACEHLSGCAERIFGEGTAEFTAAYEHSRTLLLRQGWAGICQWVSELLSVEADPERERRRTWTEKLIGYFAKHAHRLNYAEQLAAGRAIGSGVVEGQAKTLGLRLKRRGARWNLANVQPMASLVCVRHSPQWNAYWTQAV